MKRIIAFWGFLLAFSLLLISADRGSIPFKPHVKVFEPTQRAMIAWDGEEEILILSTDLRSSEPTKVLEVIPLPSEPEVKRGDVEVFKKATALINKKLKQRYARARTRGVGKRTKEAPAGEVTFHEKIGAHDVSVTHVLRSDGFVEWAENYLKEDGVENPVIPEALKAVVEEYIEEGFVWFVFDVISLDTETKTNDAIQYRFKTDFLYYPMKITRTEEGDTSINLLVLTAMLLREFPGIPIEQVRLRHEPVSLSSIELRSLSEEIDALLGHREDMKLRIWEIRGKLSSFKKDLIAK